MPAKKINLVLHDGTPYGVRTATMFNWNGALIVCPRSAVKQLRDLDEADQPAIYLLVNEENEVYIGETESLQNRLPHHALNKDFWDEVLAFTSPRLDKAKIKYLEHVFVKRLKEDGVAKIKNKTLPKPSKLGDADQDVLSVFVDRASDLLLSLHYDIIGASKEVEDIASEGVKVVCTGPDANAVGVYSESGLMVKKGSEARADVTESFRSHTYQGLRNQLVESGLLKKSQEKDGVFVFTKDKLFASPSAAAAVVLGRAANGLTEWKTPKGTTLKGLEDEEPSQNEVQTGFDTIVCPAREDGFKEAFLEEKAWWAVRIAEDKLDKLKYLAMYQVAPVSAITYYGEIDRIEPSQKDPDKYRIFLKDEPVKLDTAVERKKDHMQLQAPRYAKLESIKTATTLKEVWD